MTPDQTEFGKQYLVRLTNAGRISRILKKHLIFSKLGFEQSNTILDFGCGDLTFIKHVKNLHTATIIGVDINDNPIEIKTTKPFDFQIVKKY